MQVARLLLTGRDCLQQAAEKVCTPCFWWPLGRHITSHSHLVSCAVQSQAGEPSNGAAATPQAALKATWEGAACSALQPLCLIHLRVTPPLSFSY